MPTPDEIRHVVDTYVKAMCASDIDGIVALFAAEGTAEDPVGGEVQAGQEQLRAFYGASAPKLQVEVTGTICVSGKECAFPMTAQLTLGDNKMYLDVIDTLTFDDAGKITSMRAFWNPAEMRPTR